PRALHHGRPRSRAGVSRHGPAASCAQAARPGAAPDDRAAGLRPLDAAGAPDGGQHRDARIPGNALMAVTGFEIALRRPLADGQSFGDAGPYEELKGRLRFAIDPGHANRGVTDIALAPRGSSGRVEFSADLSLLVPVDRSRASGRALIDVV